jgi:hypothetical protein
LKGDDAFEIKRSYEKLQTVSDSSRGNVAFQSLDAAQKEAYLMRTKIVRGRKPRFSTSLLEAIEDENHGSISFNETGSVVVINDWSTFVKITMPTHFPSMSKSKSIKIMTATFQKQMNNYGATRLIFFLDL